MPSWSIKHLFCKWIWSQTDSSVLSSKKREQEIKYAKPEIKPLSFNIKRIKRIDTKASCRNGRTMLLKRLTRNAETTLLIELEWNSIFANNMETKREFSLNTKKQVKESLQKAINEREMIEQKEAEYRKELKEKIMSIRPNNTRYQFKSEYVKNHNFIKSYEII